MKKIKFFSLLALFTGLFFFSSCNPNGPGIFYSISTEKKIITSELSDKPVYKIVKAGSVMYVLAGSSIYYYKDGKTWTRIISPAETSTSDAHYLAVSLSQLNDTYVYAVYEDDSGTNIKDKIYSLNLSTVTSLPWSAVSALIDSLNLDLISTDNDSSLFFINQRTGAGAYSVYSYSYAGGLSSKLADTTLPVMGADVLSGPYYLALANATGGSQLYSTDGTSTWATETASGFDLTKTIGGISGDGGSNLYISTKDGYIYYSTDGNVSGATWTKKNSTALTDTSGTAAKLGDMVYVTFSGVPYLIIAGNTGYYEWDLGSGVNSGVPQTPSATVADFSTYDLSKEMVYSLFYDVPDTFYMGAFQGLWINNNGSLNQK